MRRILRDREITEDGWTSIATGEVIPATGDVFVPLADLRAWLAASAPNHEGHEGHEGRDGRLGVIVGTDVEIETIADVLPYVSAVAIHFTTFRDGRGYTSARLLRTRLGFRGELRATGDVLPDQVFYLWRCGFNAFDVRADKSLETARRALDTFSVAYQPAEAGPAWGRRRLLAPAV
jgi:uncharacterized protein (DUF934 family)